MISLSSMINVIVITSSIYVVDYTEIKAEKCMRNEIRNINQSLYGDRVKGRLDIDQPASPASRIGSITYEQKYSTAAPTKTHLDTYKIAKEEFTAIQQQVEQLYKNKVVTLERKLKQAGAPYTPGRALSTQN